MSCLRSRGKQAAEWKLNPGLREPRALLLAAVVDCFSGGDPPQVPLPSLLRCHELSHLPQKHRFSPPRQPPWPSVLHTHLGPPTPQPVVLPTLPPGPPPPPSKQREGMGRPKRMHSPTLVGSPRGQLPNHTHRGRDGNWASLAGCSAKPPGTGD